MYGQPLDSRCQILTPHNRVSVSSPAYCSPTASVSEDQSLFMMPPWRNWYLIGANLLSLALHFVILYVPQMARLFQLEALSWIEVRKQYWPSAMLLPLLLTTLLCASQWRAVLALSVPVLILDELLKIVARHQNAKAKKD